MLALPRRQADLLHIIESRPQPAEPQELMEAMGLSHVSSLMELAHCLEQRGLIRIEHRGRGKPRRIVAIQRQLDLTPDPPTGKLARLLADIPCGPLEAAIEQSELINIGEIFPLHDDSWFVRAHGESMYPEVFPGDILHLRKDVSWHSGDACAVQYFSELDNEGECQGTFKRLYHEPGAPVVTLKSYNESFEPFTLPADRVRVVGVWYKKQLIRGYL